MTAAILTVGTELMRPGRADTNASWIAERLERAGFVVRARAVASDDARIIASLLLALAGDAEVIVLTGGLGPTEDDRTRDGLALAFGLTLERDAECAAVLEARYRARGRSFTAEQARMADRPSGAELLPNPVGAAPGILLDRGDRLVIALPGVPAEMEAIFATGVEPRLRSRGAGTIRRRTLKVAGRTESGVDRAVRDLYDAPGIDVTILASPTGVELHIQAEGRDADEAAARLEVVERGMVDRLGDDIFGRDDETLALVVGRALADRGLTLATGESCTGGLLGGAFTEIPGSSAWYRGGVVAYADDLKTALAGVPVATLAGEGAVSAATAAALAHGVRQRCRADVGVGVTGIAGPGGATPEKPVGLVHIAVADQRGERAIVLDTPGSRGLIRIRAVTAALDLVRRRLMENG